MDARRPFELLEKRPSLFGREIENFFKTEPELLRPIYLKLYEAEENLHRSEAFLGRALTCVR